MRYHEITEPSSLAESSAPGSSVMYHGTLLSNVASILKHGLRPAESEDGQHSRWASLGGVYFSSSFEYAVQAATAKADGEPIAVVVVREPSRGALPDEDVVEKALVKAFTVALDSYGVDDAYDGDLDAYADHESERPVEWDEPPFNRDEFFRDFWGTVTGELSRIAGAPVKREPALTRSAVELALRMVDQPTPSEMEDWQRTKAALIKLYPRLRSAEQHARSGLGTPRNIRVTKTIRPSRILAVLAQRQGEWVPEYASAGYEPVAASTAAQKS